MPMPARTSPLAQATANQGKPKAPGAQGALRAALSGARVLVPWRIPRLDLDVLITLVPSNLAEQIEGQVFERMRVLGLALTISTENSYELARAKRSLAVAMLAPDTKEPIGSLDDWEALDDDLIGECWRQQLSVRSAYDPIRQPISSEQIAEIAAAVKKKDSMLLRFFGTPALANYLLATAGQASNSQTPTFGSSESSPES